MIRSPEKYFTSVNFMTWLNERTRVECAFNSVQLGSYDIHTHNVTHVLRKYTYNLCIRMTIVDYFMLVAAIDCDEKRSFKCIIDEGIEGRL